jgi:subtilisin
MIYSPQLVPAWVRDTLGWPTGRGVRVGVVGSGYDNDLPDPRVAPGLGFVDPDDDFEELRTLDDHDRIGHGTACARLILRVAPDARVIPIRIFGEQLESSPHILQSALLWAVDEKLDVVCVAGSTTIPETVHPLYSACEKGRLAGTIFVAGAISAYELSYPAYFDPVIGVLQGTFDSPFDYRYNPDAGCEVEAWGEGEIIGADGSQRLSYSHDYSAAVVAGIVALLRECYPGAPVELIRELLQRFALPQPEPQDNA